MEACHIAKVLHDVVICYFSFGDSFRSVPWILYMTDSQDAYLLL
jgi:hypothetical protein